MKGSDIISLLALIVALGAAIWTYVAWKLSGPRLHVELELVTLVEDSTMRATLNVKVTNVGRAATTIQRWHLASRTSTAFASPGHHPSRGPRTPLRLDSHETANWFIDYHPVRAALCRDHPDEVHDLEAVITYGGKRARSKGVVTVISGGTTPRPGLLKRLAGARPRSALVALWTTSPGQDEWSLVLRNVGTAPTWNVTLDRLPMTPSSPGGPPVSRHMILPGREWAVPIPSRPDGGTGMNEQAWVRIGSRSMTGRRRGEIRIGEPDQPVP